MTTIKAIRLASLVTAINVLVASGFSIAAIVRPQYLVPAESVPTEASLLLAMYAAARTIPLALLALGAIYKQAAPSLLILGALAGAMIQVGGTVGSLVLARWVERRRFFAIAFVFVAAVPIVASIGYAGQTSTTALAIATFFAGFCVLGIQTGINVAGALVYPTSLRANGSGWQLGIGRIGSIVGPLVGALLIGLPVEKLYAWSALPFAFGAVVCFAIWKLNEARLQAHPELRAAQAPA